MNIEIYLPCEPQWLCDFLLDLFALLFVAGVFMFIIILYREFQRSHTKHLTRKKKRTNKKSPP